MASCVLNHPAHYQTHETKLIFYKQAEEYQRFINNEEIFSLDISECRHREDFSTLSNDNSVLGAQDGDRTLRKNQVIWRIAKKSH